MRRDRQLTIPPEYVEYQQHPLPVPYDPRHPPQVYAPHYGYPAVPPHYPMYDVQTQSPRQSQKANLAGLAIGWFLGAWLLAALHPAITLGMWFIGVAVLLNRALR